jgi:hypothetical protein
MNANEDGSCIITTFDNPENDYPEEEGCVRMTSPLAGFLFIPDKNDPNKCTATMVIEADLKGYVPGYVFKIAINDSAQGMHIIKKLMDKYLEEFKDEVSAPIIE